MIACRATRNREKIIQQRQREQGYADGYAGRVARSALLVYQRSYRLGVAARERDRHE